MSTLLLLTAAPLVFSAAVALLRRLAARGAVLADGIEKALLGLMLLPLAAGLLIRFIPVPAPVLAALPLPALAEDDSVVNAVMATATTPHPDLLHFAPQALLLLWAAGAAVALVRLALAITAYARIATRARPLEDGVRLTEADTPAFAWRGSVVVPQSLRDALPAAQMRLIVAHERAHLRRRDPLWFLLFGLLDALLWFNPFVTAQTRACRLAAELACDAAAVEGGSRRAYARALLAALKAPQAGPAAVPTLSGKDGYRLRLDRIMTRRPAPRAVAWLCAAVVLALPVVLGQFAFAKGQPASLATPIAAALQDAAPPPAAPAYALPVDGQIGETFGMRKDPLSDQMKYHEGVDFLAPVGTPVKASAAGTVSFVGDRTGYGTVVEIDHGNLMKTRYAHLSRADVATGDTVSQGQVVGAVGITGRSTKQPHLHFEIWLDGKPQDPAPYLGLTQN